MTSLSDKLPLDAAADIAEGAAAMYWLHRTTSDDPNLVEHDGRVVPTVKVRNDAEYAAMAVGQVGVMHFLWPILGMPYIVITLCLTVVLPGMLLNNAGSGQDSPLVILTIPLFFFWIWLFVWRLFIRKLITKGPKIDLARNYHGVFRP